MRANPKKLLIWDGDETLWIGTITAGDPVSIPANTLHMINCLKDIGVLQAIASNNLPQDVDAVLHKYGVSTLFLANRVDFSTSKADMVRAIMEDLGLVNPDNVLFIDDNPLNTAEVSKLGVECMNTVDWNKIMDVFEKPEYTKEDADRVEMYRSELARKSAAASYSGDRMEFFKSCKMQACIRKAELRDMPRIESLVQRANRLGAMERRYGGRTLGAFLKSGELYVLEAEDIYGKYGLSGVARRTVSGVKDNSSIITMLVISCRLRGRGYGSAFLGHLINLGAEEARDTCAKWIETEYNAEVRKLYEWYGFTITKDDNLCTATLQTIGVSLPNWISITSES